MDIPSTGAAYILISHGESGGGAYTSAGVLAPTASTDGTEEQNLGEQGNPAARIKKDEVDAAFSGQARKKA